MDLFLQIYLGLTITLSVFALIIVILAVAHTRLSKKYSDLKQTNLDQEIEVNRKTAEILEKAEADYTKITSDASQRAKEMITKAVLIKEDTEISLLKTFEELDKKQKELIKKTTRDIFKKYNLKTKALDLDNINIQNNVSKDIETYSKNAIDDYREAALEETLTSQNALKDRVKIEYEIIEEKLNAYKKEKLKEIDDNIYNIIRDTAKESLGKTISINDHKDLIIQALEKAKKERKI